MRPLRIRRRARPPSRARAMHSRPRAVAVSRRGRRRRSRQRRRRPHRTGTSRRRRAGARQTTSQRDLRSALDRSHKHRRTHQFRWAGLRTEPCASFSNSPADVGVDTTASSVTSPRQCPATPLLVEAVAAVLRAAAVGGTKMRQGTSSRTTRRRSGTRGLGACRNNNRRGGPLGSLRRERLPPLQYPSLSVQCRCILLAACAAPYGVPCCDLGNASSPHSTTSEKRFRTKSKQHQPVPLLPRKEVKC
jgi:hypothetical protein